MPPTWRKGADSASTIRSALDDNYRPSQLPASSRPAHRSVPIPPPTKPHNLFNTIHVLQEHGIFSFLLYLTSALLFTYLSFLYRQHNPYTSYTSLLCHFSIFYRKQTTDTQMAVVLESLRILFTREIRNWIGDRLRNSRHKLLLLIAYGAPEYLRLSIQLLCRSQLISHWFFFGYRSAKTGSVWWHIFWLTYAGLKISVNTLDYLVLLERKRQKNGEIPTIFAGYAKKWENGWWWRDGVAFFLEPASGVEEGDEDHDDRDNGGYGNENDNPADEDYEFVDYSDAFLGPEHDSNPDYDSEHEDNNQVDMVNSAPFLANGIAVNNNDNNSNNNNNSIFGTVVDSIFNQPATPKPPTLRSTHALLRKRDIYRPLFYILWACFSTYNFCLPPTSHPWSTYSLQMSICSGFNALVGYYHLGKWIFSRLNFPQRRTVYLILTTSFALLYVSGLAFLISLEYYLTARSAPYLLRLLYQNKYLAGGEVDPLFWVLKLPSWIATISPVVAGAFWRSLTDYLDMVEVRRRTEREGWRVPWKKLEFATWEGENWGWWEEKWE